MLKVMNKDNTSVIQLVEENSGSEENSSSI